MAQSYRQYWGQLGEQAAKRFVEKQGWHILDKNWRYGKQGEIDLIAFDSVRKIIHFIEVKTRRTDGEQGSPLEAITERKQNRLINLVEVYLQDVIAEDLRTHCVSIDLFAVWILGNTINQMELIENIVS